VLPATPGPLTFDYSFAHTNASTSSDWFRVYVWDLDADTRTLVYAESGTPRDKDGSWVARSVPLDAWAGRRIRVVFAARDGGPRNLVEAEVDDVRIRRP